ncbi:MAG: PEP-CTERM sorting domain-containing protein [Sedimentisphaerales bacterium]|nr:PEP-CTERM sorting domain-containing protein [Sedimentisphaerales bacterium]
MKTRKLLLILVAALMIAAGPVAAMPLPTGQTAQQWDFDNNSNPAIPEIDLNPYGTAIATMAGSDSGPPPDWVTNLLGRDGVWTGEGILKVILEIPNQMIPNPYKEIGLEIGFVGDLVDFSIIPIPIGGSVELVEQNIEVVDPTNGWLKLTAKFILEPNPYSEIICYSFASGLAAIDYIIVKTICVPEPMTVSLIGLGGLILARRRRRS